MWKLQFSKSDKSKIKNLNLGGRKMNKKILICLIGIILIFTNEKQVMANSIKQNFMNIEVNEQVIKGDVIEDENGFKIYNGNEVIKYKGEGGDVVIPDGIEIIDSYAFQGCSNVTSITMPDSVRAIGYAAFYSCSGMTEINLSKKLGSINDYVFYGCSKLKNITIPKSVTTIGEYDFDGCSVLENINVDAENKTYKSVDGILYNKDGSKLIRCPEGKEGDIKILEDTVCLAKGSLSECSRITNISLPEKLSEIETFSFSQCGLTQIFIPENVKSIGEEAFNNCWRLQEINVSEKNSAYKSQDGILYNGDGTELIQCPQNKTGSVIIPKGLISIHDSAFFYSAITNVVIPDGAQSIGYKAFYCCSQLKYVVVPSTVKDIGEDAFSMGFPSVNPGFFIYCEQGSYAEKYVQSHSGVSCKYGLPKKEQSITASNFEKKYGSTTFYINATTNGDGKLSYWSDNEDVVKVDKNGKVTIVGAGVAYITITASETDNYESCNKTVVIKIKPASESAEDEKTQIITAKDIIKTYSTKPFQLNVRTNGSGKLTYKVSDKKIATVSTTGKVTIKGYGKTKITICAAAKGKYKAAKKTIVLTVKPVKTQIISVKSKKAKTVTVKWKQDKKATGYMVQISTDKKFKKNVKISVVSKNKTMSQNITKLKPGKQYYVRVCTYNKSGKDTIKGSYSKVKTIKVN